MQQENFSGEQSLELIRSMINKAKNQFSENGHLYLVWGWVVFICSVTQFVLLHFLNYEKHYLVWLFIWVAVVYQFIYLYRNRNKQLVKTYMSEILSYVWQVFIVLILLTTFLFSMLPEGERYKFIDPFILLLYGMPTFLSGKILRFTPLVLGGIGCWILSMASAYLPYEYQMLCLAFAVIVAWIVPGYLLRKRYNFENK